MTTPLKLDHLYVALQYPENPVVDHELCPELLPACLQTQANGDCELEYTWSFILPFKLNGEIIAKQYTLVYQTKTENNPEILNRRFRNEHLLKHGRSIEICVRSPWTLAIIPRLMVLLEIQPVDMHEFEAFLASHNDFTNWTRLTKGDHATHLWARNVLIDYRAIKVNDVTIILVEAAARTSVRRHQRLRRKTHDWTSFKGTPLWQVYIYDVRYSGCCR
ncbi:hypothetical protein F4782DRAFT_465357 [Xylaria castorea]|nr:hypothetical protein F4782DRAFT_465357 [Xylaria castorea]